MCDDYDNGHYDPDYYDKEFRDAYPNVYGYDEYAQQFSPVRRSSSKPARRSSGKSTKKSVSRPVRKTSNSGQQSKNGEIAAYVIFAFFIYAVMIIILIWLFSE